ncbi:MAG: hypothetical protein K2J40_00070 [Ruminococcus sp.]|nr:hypothetical protein [Ruminococcus sp.]
MITDIKQGCYGIEGKIYSEIFGTEIEVMINGAEIEYAQKCAEHFNNMTEKMLDVICRGAKAYCMDFMEDVGGDVYGKMKISVTSETPALEMLKCFKPTVLIIKKPKNENKIGYQLECRCDWEIEHGMEIDILDDKVVYLSSFNGRSPWHEYDTDKEYFLNTI